MPLPRYGAKRDANEDAIVLALRKAGASVTPLSVPGCVDLLVGYQGDTFLLEIKDGRNGLTDEQQAWHAAWRGRKPWIVRTIEEALEAIGIDA